MDLIEDAIATLPNSLQLSGGKLLASSGAWIVCEGPDSPEDAPHIFLGDRAQIFGDRLLVLQAISCLAP